jgi:hypothetical protein
MEVLLMDLDRSGAAPLQGDFPTTPAEAAGWLGHRLLVPAGMDEPWKYEIHWETGSEHSWSPDRKVTPRGIILRITSPITADFCTHTIQTTLGLARFTAGVLKGHIFNLQTPESQQIQLGSMKEMAAQYAHESHDAVTIDAMTYAGFIVEAFGFTSRGCQLDNMWVGVAATKDTLQGFDLVTKSP